MIGARNKENVLDISTSQSANEIKLTFTSFRQPVDILMFTQVSKPNPPVYG